MKERISGRTTMPARRVVLVGLFALLASGLPLTAQDADTSIGRDLGARLSALPVGTAHEIVLSPDELAALDENVVFVDIRTPSEWQETGVLANARLVTFAGEASFLQELQALTRERPRPVVLICRSDNRTGQAARLLAPRLDAPVISVVGGMIALLRERPALAVAPSRPFQCLSC